MDFLADTSYKQSQAEVIGQLTASAVASGSQLVGYSGFSNEAFIREPYSSDLDFGTGEWSASAWVNIPATLPIESFSATGNELVTNGTFDVDTSGWTTSGPATISHTNGVLVVEKTSSAATDFGVSQNISFAKPGAYKVTCVVNRNYSANNTQFAVVMRNSILQFTPAFGVNTVFEFFADIPLAGTHTLLIRSAFGGGATGEYFTVEMYRDWETDRKSTRLNSSHRL